MSPAGLSFSWQTACSPGQRGQPQDEHQLWVCSDHLRLTSTAAAEECEEKIEMCFLCIYGFEGCICFPFMLFLFYCSRGVSVLRFIFNKAVISWLSCHLTLPDGRSSANRCLETTINKTLRGEQLVWGCCQFLGIHCD